MDIPTTDLISYAFENTDFSDDPIYVDAEDRLHQLTWRDARQYVCKLIGILQDLGVRHGDAVCIYSYNQLWYPILYLAIIGSGAVFVGANPAYTRQELTRFFSISKPKIVLCQPKLQGNVSSIAESCGIARQNILTLNLEDSLGSDKDANSLTMRKFLESREAPWRSFSDEETARSSPAVMLWTSGTGGLPKAALMSHYALVTQCAHAEWIGRHIDYKVRRLLCLPASHSFVLPYHVLPLRTRERSFVMRRFNHAIALTCIEENSITSIPLVPPIALDLLNAGSGKVPELRSIREIICAGAPLSRQLQQTLLGRLSERARFVQLWGMSETGWLTGFEHPEGDDTGSVGRALPKVEIRVLNQQGEDIRTDSEQGELYVKTEGVSMGYLNDRSQQLEGFEEGWFRTGDIGYLHEGKVYVVDRAKDLIKVRGWQVSPAEVENCLLQCRDILDAAVIGITADEYNGELPKAFVVLKSGSKMDQGDVQAFVRQRLAKYKALDGGVTFVDKIPRTASGKILRRQLKGTTTYVKGKMPSVVSYELMQSPTTSA